MKFVVLIQLIAVRRLAVRIPAIHAAEKVQETYVVENAFLQCGHILCSFGSKALLEGASH